MGCARVEPATAGPQEAGKAGAAAITNAHSLRRDERLPLARDGVHSARREGTERVTR